MEEWVLLTVTRRNSNLKFSKSLLKRFCVVLFKPTLFHRQSTLQFSEKIYFYLHNTIPVFKGNNWIHVKPVGAAGGPGSVNWDTRGGGAPREAHKQPSEKQHQFWHRQPPSHRLGRHNARAPYLQRQEEGRQICTGWKHSHGRNGQNQLLPSSINVAPTFTVQQLTSNWSYPWPVMTS